MPNNDQTQIVQCTSCDAKLRVAGNARGKTIACPKCNQTLKIKDTAPARPLVVAKPVASPTVSQGSPLGSGNQPGMASSYGTGTALDSNWSSLQLPPASAPYQPYAAQPAAGSSNKMWIWIAVGGGCALLFMGISLIVLLSMRGASQSVGNPTAVNTPSPTVAPPRQPPLNTPTSPPANVPSSASGGGLNRASRLPSGARGDRGPARGAAVAVGGAREFPELGNARPFGQKIVLHRVMIPRNMQKPLVLNVFMPTGQHADQSLPVMFEAPSGTNLLHGAEVEAPRPSTEYLPFTDAGMITVSFSIDGEMPRSMGPDAGAAYMSLLQRAYKEFVAADAGVTSGKLAIDYVLDKVPAADPKRLYIWGHSSAATLSLLMASKDERLAKCIALAPITDLNQRLGELSTEPSMSKLLPNLPEYFKTGSPKTYVNQLKCPVFVAHAKDDDNEPFKNTQAYVSALRAAGGKITFAEPASGGHYQALLDENVPKALEWLKAD